MNASTLVDLSARPAGPHVRKVSIIVEADDITNADPAGRHDCGDPECANHRKTFGRHWHYVGVRAVAEVVVANVCQRIHSGGLWGIESDDDEYIHMVGREEYDALANVLAGLGVQLDIPFGNAEWMER